MSVRLFAPKVKHMFGDFSQITETFTGLGFAGRLCREHPFAMVEVKGEHMFAPPTERKHHMTTIILDGSLQPSRVRTPRRDAIREAARTREIRRVYRRRRFGVMLAVATIAIVAVFGVFSLFGASVADDVSNGRAEAPRYLVAQPGDTLWSIGERIAPNSAITEVVDELVRLNGTNIQTGQLVRIP